MVIHITFTEPNLTRAQFLRNVYNFFKETLKIIPLISRGLPMNEPKQTTPKYWWLLTEQDKAGYTYIRSFIKNNPESNQRNKRLSTFTDMIEVIRRYAIRGDAGDANRCLVCGILWLPGAIAINTHQLGFLMAKCKSSINGSLQILGYKEKIARKSASDLVGNSLYAIRNDRSELRKWTVRSLDNIDIETINQTLENNKAEQQDGIQNPQKSQISIQQMKIKTLQKRLQNIQLPQNIPQQIISIIPTAINTKKVMKEKKTSPIEQTKNDIPTMELKTDNDNNINNTRENTIATSHEVFDFPLPPKKDLLDSNELFSNDSLYSIRYDGCFNDFSKEDAILKLALNDINQNSEITDFWNIGIISNDSFFF